MNYRGILGSSKLLREVYIYFDEAMCYMEDAKYYIDILLANGKIHFINDRLYHYRVENNSVSHSFTVDQIKKNFNSIINVLNDIEIKYKDKFKIKNKK